MHVRFVDLGPDLGEGGVDVGVDTFGKKGEELGFLEMTGDIEEKFGVFGELEEFSFLRGVAVEEKRGAISQAELGDDGIPVAEIGADLGCTLLPVVIDAAIGGKVLDHPDVPAGEAEAQNPLEEGPGIACPMDGVAGKVDSDDSAAGHELRSSECSEKFECFSQVSSPQLIAHSFFL